MVSMFKNTEDLKKFLLDKLDELKIEDIISIDVSKTSSITDYVIIGTGRSGKQIESSMAKIKEELKKNEVTDILINGTADSGWIICDLGNIIIHLFTEEVRKTYNLEDLWAPKNKKNAKSVANKIPGKKPVVKKSTKTPIKKTTTVKKTTVSTKKSATVKKPTKVATKKLQK